MASQAPSTSWSRVERRSGRTQFDESGFKPWDGERDGAEEPLGASVRAAGVALAVDGS